METITSESKLVEVTKNYVKDRYLQETPGNLLYHDLAHTMEVMDAAIRIGEACHLSEREIEVVKIAAMLHDIGYLESCKEHEKNSAIIAEQFLQTQGANDELIEKVKGCILATCMPQKATNLIEEVLCDADLVHLASDNYSKKADLLKKEWEVSIGKTFTEEEWQQKNIKFFNAHKFYTDYAKKYLEEGKKHNLETLMLKEPVEEKKKKKEKIKKTNPQQIKMSRGVETLFRTTSTNHISLSSIADTKANIMISVNSILLSILLTVLFRKFDEYPHLAIPTIIFALVSLLTIIFAILATRPKIINNNRSFMKEDIYDNNTNMLFFGNFNHISLQDYEWSMKEIIKDDDLIYGNMIRDIYYLGKVLNKKYRLLRISYTIFMYGLVVSISAFIFVFLYFYQSASA